MKYLFSFRERLEREKTEKEKVERERAERERIERERAEKERQERERLAEQREWEHRQERERILREAADTSAAAAVDQHFTESLSRLANQRVSASIFLNLNYFNKQPRTYFVQLYQFSQF